MINSKILEPYVYSPRELKELQQALEREMNLGAVAIARTGSRTREQVRQTYDQVNNKWGRRSDMDIFVLNNHANVSGSVKRYDRQGSRMFLNKGGLPVLHLGPWIDISRLNPRRLYSLREYVYQTQVLKAEWLWVSDPHATELIIKEARHYKSLGISVPQQSFTIPRFT